MIPLFDLAPGRSLDVIAEVADLTIIAEVRSESDLVVPRRAWAQRVELGFVLFLADHRRVGRCDPLALRREEL